LRLWQALVLSTSRPPQP